MAPGQPFIIIHLFCGSTALTSDYDRTHGAGEQTKPVSVLHDRAPNRSPIPYALILPQGWETVYDIDQVVVKHGRCVGKPLPGRP
jgi:hypothetical protein